jgi:predicted alpha/beta-fold hydrolase
MRRFIPAFGLKNGHLQTIFPTFFTKQSLPKVNSEIFELSDGDFVETLWHQKPTKSINKPIIVLFHGLAGSVNSPYIKRVMSLLGENNFCVVLMHFRGCGKEPNRLPRSYHSGDTNDAKELLRHLKKIYPDNPIFAVGYSLGGNMLLKLLGELGDNFILKGAIAVSVPMWLESSANRMNIGLSKLYQHHLISTLKKSLQEKYTNHNMEKLIGLTKEQVADIKTFWEFDDVYTAPIHGFKNAADYYKKSSSKQYLKDIKTKTLIIHSVDDPFMSTDVIPREDELSENVELELYQNGGHMGFVAGSFFKPRFWLEERILKFLTDFTI